MKVFTRATALSAVALCTLGLAGLSIPAAQADVIAPAAAAASTATPLTADEANMLAQGFRAAERSSDGTVHVTMSKALFTSNINVKIMNGGRYIGETSSGKAYYASILNENDSTISLSFHAGPVNVGDTVTVLFGRNGEPVTTTAFSFTAGGVDSLVRGATDYSAHVTAAADKNMPRIGFEINGAYAGEKGGSTYYYFSTGKVADGYNLWGNLPREGSTLTAFVPYTIAGSGITGKVILASAERAPYAINVPATVTKVGAQLMIGKSGADCIGDGVGGSGYGYDCLAWAQSNPLRFVPNETYFDIRFNKGTLNNPLGFLFDGYWRATDMGQWQIEGCSDESCASTTVISTSQKLSTGVPIAIDANTAGTNYQSYRFRYLGGGATLGVPLDSHVGTSGITEVSVMVK
jgi:hypothetical protein